MRELTEEDWARIRAEARAVRDRAMALERAPMATAPRTRVGVSRKGMKMTGTPRYDRERIRQMRLAGIPTPQIARELGAHTGTIYRVLAELGLGSVSGKSGPPRKEFCKRNHPLAEYGRELKGGGRECGECKRITDREAARKRYHAKKGAAQ